MADAQDLGSCTARCVGSTPTVRNHAPGSSIRRDLGCLAFVVSILSASLAAAHEFRIADTLFILKTDQSFQLDIRIDVDAIILGVPPSTDSAEVKAQLEAASPDERARWVEDAKRTLQRRVRVHFDETAAALDVSFPEFGTVIATSAEVPTLYGTTARFTGLTPSNAGTLSVRLSRAFGPAHLTVVDQAGLRIQRYVLSPGEDSPAFEVVASATASQAALPGGAACTFGQYLALGFEHILPKGVDHMLFVLALYLLSTHWRPLLAQITAFTAAHTLTLALTMLGILALPARLVETVIALSIAYVAIENIITTRLHAQRVILVFVFGLLHGMGFAGVLAELGLPRGQFWPSLLGFNLGVEAGQIAVVLIAFAVLGWFRKRTWYRKIIVIPVSILIGLVGLIWSVERAFLT